MKLALVTCRDLPEPDVDEAMLMAECRDAGFDTELAAWDDPDVDWSRFDVALIRSTWDYYLAPESFREWVEATARVTRLLNPAPVVLGNLDKTYLQAWDDKGIPIVPTVFFEVGSVPNLESAKLALAGFSDGFVIKPTVSAGSWETYRFFDSEVGAACLLESVAHRPTMLQPYLPEVERGGEISCVCLGGRFSHAVVKAPRFNDEHEAVVLGEADAAALDLVHRVLAELDSSILYARVDLMRHQNQWVLSELELVEPSLFLTQNPAACTEFVRCLKSILAHS
ncbi:MAG: hypothetical protein LCH41_07310 [Armatimonadetes bacterium]|nr:hypothetical protein [Armatimonadota bacterium]